MRGTSDKIYNQLLDILPGLLSYSDGDEISLKSKNGADISVCIYGKDSGRHYFPSLKNGFSMSLDNRLNLETKIVSNPLVFLCVYPDEKYASVVSIDHMTNDGKISIYDNGVSKKAEAWEIRENANGFVERWFDELIQKGYKYPSSKKTTIDGFYA